MRQDGTGDVVHSEEVDLHLAVGVGAAGVFRRAGDAESGIVHKNIDPSLGADDPADGRKDLALVGHVRREVDDAVLGDLPAAEFIDPAAGVQQRPCRTAADAAGPAGDNGDLSHCR